MCKKEYQLPLDIDDQVENLKDLGIIISDENDVRDFLNDVM